MENNKELPGATENAMEIITEPSYYLTDQAFKENRMNGEKAVMIGEAEDNDEPDYIMPLEVTFIEGDSSRDSINRIFKDESWDDKGLSSDHFACYHCGKNLKSFKGLKFHIKKRHINELHNILDFQNNKEEKRHINDKRRHTCPFCNYRSDNLFHLNSHVLGVHTSDRPFKCSKCDYKTAYLRALRAHTKTVHAKGKMYRCSKCKYSTGDPDHLKSHIQTIHSGEKEITKKEQCCPLCVFTTACPQALKNHIMALHKTGKVLKSSECNYESSDSNDLESHPMTHYSAEKPYKCPYCPFRMPHYGNISAHIMEMHLEECKKKCPYCKYSTIHPFSLKTHIISFHEKEPDTNLYLKIIKTNENIEDLDYTKSILKYSLNSYLSNQLVFKGSKNIFNYNFSKKPSESINVLQNPIERSLHSNNYTSKIIDQTINSCYSSSSSGQESPEIINFPNKNVLTHKYKDKKQHFEDNTVDTEYLEPGVLDLSMNSSDVLINCKNMDPEIIQLPINPYEFPLSPDLDDQDSGIVESPVELKQYSCLQCDFICTSSIDLKHHINKEHPDLKFFPCSKCDFTAEKSSLLKYHVKSIHKAAEGESVHQCPECPYCTETYEKLQIHIRVKHIRNRPFKCPQCPYSSTQAGHIRIHVRAKHTDEKPYHCSYCGYQSAYSSALKSHIMKRHTNN